MSNTPKPAKPKPRKKDVPKPAKKAGRGKGSLTRKIAPVNPPKPLPPAPKGTAKAKGPQYENFESGEVKP